jgi:PatG C-terminal/Subtilase family
VIIAPSVAAVPVAVIDGPYDAAALSGILAQAPVSLGDGGCSVNPNAACNHGTFIMGMLGARRDASIPGLCPDSKLVHVPLFVDEGAPWASVASLAHAISIAVAAGARLINLSLAILGDETQNHRELAAALDLAEASGAVIVVAAGNQGRLAMGRLLSHRATIPVVAVDAARRLLPDCNFGPSISRRGVAALGHRVLGYLPGGATTVMSGTSVATAVTTGILARLWSSYPSLEGADILAAVARIGPRENIPPMLEYDVLLAGLGRMDAATIAANSRAGRGRMNYASLQGAGAMAEGNGTPRLPNHNLGPATISGHEVVPAGCACGAPGGICSCSDAGSSPSNFVYVLGSLDIDLPDQSISEELQAVARMKGIVQAKDEPLRDWYFKVLSNPEARYVARQVCWILKVEGQPAYYLALRDPFDLPELISCLGHPEDDLNLVVGSSSLIPVETCPGVAAPVLAVDQLSMFKKAALIKWINSASKKALPPPWKGKAIDAYASNPGHLFDRLVQSADNFGDTDEWRALNYLAVTYQPLYEQYAVMLKNGWSLDSVKVTMSRLSRNKRIVDPVFAFRQVETGTVQKYFVRVDVSHLFPMMVNHIAEYFDR